MKIGICGDVHWSQYSSILRKRGNEYSARLENLIQSINWFNQLSEEHNCCVNFYAGDFFDKADCNSEEISALSKINWVNVPQYFLCGNHEMGLADHSYSSAKIFNLLPQGIVISKPTQIRIGDLDICLLPYILESNRQSLETYFTDKPVDRFGLKIPRLILSHNDIAGLQMGKFISEIGFSIDEFENNASIVINGHLHNGEKVTDKIINIGNLTGQNFSEDATKYDHCAFILDTDSLKIEVYENPFAFNFYKLDLVNSLEIPVLKSNAVISAKCKAANLETVKNMLSTNKNIVESRVTIEPELQVISEDIKEELTVDHLETFKQYIIDNFENTKELMEELNEVLK